MSDHRITRNQATNNEFLKHEVEAFNPFAPRRELPRGKDDHTSLHSSNFDYKEIEENKEQRITTDINPCIQSNTEGEINQKIKEKQITIMAVPTVTLKDALKIVPEFDGENISLGEFFEGCDEALEMIGKDGEANLTKLLRSKLLGEARKAIRDQSFANVEALKDYLKTIYAPIRSIHQLQGEMGNEFQNDDESVISFANRIRNLGKRILEAQKVTTGNVTEAFRQTIESASVECFKRGLKPDIERKLENANDMTNIVRNAIKAERDLEAQKALRNSNKNIIKFKESRRVVNFCQICKAQDHETSHCKTKPITLKTCQVCKKPGHTEETCYFKTNNCQICSMRGHTAINCKNNTRIIKCQLCENTGHSAKECRSRPSNNQSCQICQRLGHTANNCMRNKNNFQPQVNNRAAVSSCQLCRKPGHIASNCYSNKFCQYCKNKGHIVEECRKKRYAEANQSGNEQGVSRRSAKVETPRVQSRSTNLVQTEDLDFDLLQLE